MCKKIMAFSLLMLLSLNAMAETINGQFQVTLTILPDHGCTKELCVINKENLVKQMEKSNFNNKQNFIVEKKGSEIIVTF